MGKQLAGVCVVFFSEDEEKDRIFWATLEEAKREAVVTLENAGHETAIIFTGSADDPTARMVAKWEDGQWVPYEYKAA